MSTFAIVCIVVFCSVHAVDLELYLLVQYNETNGA